MDSLKAIYTYIVNTLAEACVDTPELDARIMIEERTVYDWSDIISKPEAVIELDSRSKILADLDVRIAGKPLSRIYGKGHFWSLDFKISPDTLDPRQDTELVIDMACQKLDKKKSLKILDLGTGSGCIAISLLSEFPNAHAVGTDISPRALSIAKYNAKHYKVDNRISFICGSWFDPLSVKNVNYRFDLIVSNPPYIKNHIIPTLSKEVKNHDPILALDGGANGLQAYKILFSHLKSFLKIDGTALFEIGYDQADDVMRLSQTAGFALRTVHPDLAGNPRVVEISRGDK